MTLRMKPEERNRLIESVLTCRSEAKGWNTRRINMFISGNARGDFWYFGRPTAYTGRRMGLAAAFHEESEEAGRKAKIIVRFAEKQILYRRY